MYVCVLSNYCEVVGVSLILTTASTTITQKESSLLLSTTSYFTSQAQPTQKLRRIRTKNETQTLGDDYFLIFPPFYIHSVTVYLHFRFKKRKGFLYSTTVVVLRDV